MGGEYIRRGYSIGKSPELSGHMKEDSAQEKPRGMGRAVSCWALWHGKDCGFFHMCNGNPLKDFMKKNGIIGFASK